jgi:hypothetical protein
MTREQQRLIDYAKPEAAAHDFAFKLRAARVCKEALAIKAMT